MIELDLDVADQESGAVIQPGGFGHRLTVQDTAFRRADRVDQPAIPFSAEDHLNVGDSIRMQANFTARSTTNPHRAAVQVITAFWKVRASKVSEVQLWKWHQ
jgi:hypothetical protein